MGYELEHHVPIEADTVRVMSEQQRKALADLDRIGDDAADAIHSCRKRCKKIRGAARLVRPAMTGDAYSTINALARDAARALARQRDARTMAQTLDRLGELSPLAELETRSLDTVAVALAQRCRELEHDIARDAGPVERSAELLTELGRAIAAVGLDESGFDAIGPGLTKTYRRGRDALDTAIGAPTGPNFHDWRKRAKYTRSHLDLLTAMAPTVVKPMERSFHRLTDALGDAHDLFVLGEWLRHGPTEVDQLGDTTDLHVVIDGTRVELEHRAIALGRRLYAETPKRFTKRLGAYWEVWDAEQRRSPAGTLEAAFG